MRHCDWHDHIDLEQLLAESEVLPQSFYERPTEEVAQLLLGKILIHGPTAGLITETEAYLGLEDLAAHASRGLTERTRAIFGPPGHAYVYFIYGMHECFNVVCEPNGVPGAVLVRALQPLCGLKIMKRRRPKAKRIEDLCSGPARLAQALAITRKQYGLPLYKLDAELKILKWAHEPEFEIVVTPRVGIRECVDWPLRFLIKSSPYVSKPSWPPGTPPPPRKRTAKHKAQEPTLL